MSKETPPAAPIVPDSETAGHSARRQRTRAKLLAAALDVFVDVGLQAASVEAVCARAGFSRGAFYSNFESKEELFLTLLTHEFHTRAHDVQDKIEALAPQLLGRGESLRPEEATRFIAEFFTPHGAATAWYMLETELSLLAMRDPAVAPGLANLTRNFNAQVTDAVTLAITAAGRTLNIPVERAVTLLGAVYERALRVSAVDGPTAPDGLIDLPAQISELIFALTTPTTHP